jgi:hypothetical protein
VSACGGGGAAGANAQWYRTGYDFGVDHQGSPSVQADSPTQFCNAALRTATSAGSSTPSTLASPAARGAAPVPAGAGTNAPRNVPPVVDYAGESAWLAGCVAGLTSE